MTIDEIIKNLQFIRQKGFVSCEEQAQTLEEAIELIEWYESQDLIPRKDALKRIENLKRLERHPDHVITLHHSYCAVGEIPKAEPPKGNEVVMKPIDGDCETCKHYAGTGGRWCKSCSRTYLDNYEPYIPKEE